MTYVQLRDFLDRYTNERGEIQGDPATIAAEAVAAGLVASDDEHARQIEDDVVLGKCPHGVDLDRAFCPKGCRV